MKRLRALLAISSSVVLLITGCTEVVEGKAISAGANPKEVAGKPVTEAPSGLRPNAQVPKRSVENGDGGPIDNLAATSVDDIEQFWTEQYRAPFKGRFIPVDALFSYDSREKSDGTFCGQSTVRDTNAAFCYLEGDHNCPASKSAKCTSSYNTIGWDRGVYLADRRAAYGDMGVAATLGHEYGHAIQRISAKLITGNSTKERLAGEQQADCFSGAYIRWVVDGKSPRFTLSTGDALSKVIATRILVRDPLLSAADPMSKDELVHGSAFERVSAFLFGFNDGVFACATIDPDEILQRRENLPKDLLGQGETGEYGVSEESIKNVIEALNKVFAPTQSPTLSLGQSPCPDAKSTPPVSYCPATNAIAVDMNRLILMGTSLTRGSPLDEGSLLIGDYSAYSILVSRYMLAVQNRRGGLALNNDNAGLRTACLTGVASAKFAPGVTLANGVTIKIYGGDLDEALSGVLTNGMAASNVDGAYVPSGIARVDAFRSGVLGDDANCYRTWP